jgi:putative oxygen-independent coproporphyrinogen III oxidase
VIGLYVHVPFCTVRCSYCDFYLVPARGRDLPGYVQAAVREIGEVARGIPIESKAQGERPPAPDSWPRPADTLHFGGGTPSLLPGEALRRLVGAARRAFALDAEAEVALEANPEDLTALRLQELRRAGITRLAIGVQSLDDRLLKLMRRPHDAAQALAALQAAQSMGFASLAVDLILGLPGQGAASALEDLARLVDRGVDHVSLYLLEVHPRTRLGRAAALGRTRIPPDDATADLYERASDLMTSRGFEHYEISNFARPGHRSRHNVKYWTDQEYLGFGPSAHSYVGGERWSNAPDLRAYVARGGADAERRLEKPGRLARGVEALVAGMRLLEGVDLEALRGRYDPRLPGPEDAVVAELRRSGLVEMENGRLKLTRRGRLVSNEVLERLAPSVS